MMKQAIKMLMGSVVVYMAVASCVGMDVPPGGLGSGGEGGRGGSSSRAAMSSSASVGGHGGAPGGNGGSTGSVLNPVPPAQAESGTRLKARFMLGADGSKSFYGNFWDSALQTNCSFASMSDGTQRCAPIDGPTVTGLRYSDPACTKEVANWSSCYAISVPYTKRFDYIACPATWHIYVLGAQVQATDVYAKGSGACIKAPVDAATTYYEIGAELPPTDFVAGSEGHE